MRKLPLVLLFVLPVLAQEDSRRLKPGHAPTPFSAEEIRGGCPDGRISVFKIETQGRDPIHQTMAFREGDEQGCGTQPNRTVYAADSRTRHRQPWPDDLAQHALASVLVASPACSA